jgi:hypothetical protein
LTLRTSQGDTGSSTVVVRLRRGGIGLAPG